MPGRGYVAMYATESPPSSSAPPTSLSAVLTTPLRRLSPTGRDLRRQPLVLLTESYPYRARPQSSAQSSSGHQRAVPRDVPNEVRLMSRSHSHDRLGMRQEQGITGMGRRYVVYVTNQLRNRWNRGEAARNGQAQRRANERTGTPSTQDQVKPRVPWSPVTEGSRTADRTPLLSTHVR